jgi:hypothetical protein
MGGVKAIGGGKDKKKLAQEAANEGRSIRNNC